MSTDSYLLSKYGITLDERDAIMWEQDYKCVCGRSLKDPDVRLEVDHEHYKIIVVRGVRGIENGWWAHPTLENCILTFWGKTKDAAIAAVKKSRQVKRLSVRGVLCGGRYAGCNRKIGRIDKPDWLLAVHAYLKDPPARKVLK